MRGGYSAATMATCRDDLLEEHADLVKRIAYHLANRLPPSVQVDDLVQAGMIGLLDAARNYDRGRNASFKTYASIRIRGAMLDEIRKNDWIPRSVHSKAKMLATAIRTVENREGRDARAQEIAEELGISLEKYYELLQSANGQKVLSLDETLSEDGDGSLLDALTDEAPCPMENMQEQDVKNTLAEAVAGLPERERMVMSLYYDEELNLREIGQVMGVSESRISQIHSQAIIRLQARITR